VITDDTTLPAGVTQTEGTDPTAVTAVAGTDTFTDNDGFYQPAEVCGFIYEDINGNGVQDGAEAGILGVDVVITASDGTTQTVTTDANGEYCAEVVPGNTTADVDETTLPPGVLQTEGTDPTSVTAVGGTTEDIGTDGYYELTEICGHLYIDTDANGMQDAGEPNLVGVDVVITNSAGVPTTVTTDGNGDYCLEVPPGLTITDIDETDPDYPAGYTQTEGGDPTFTVAQAGMSNDAGNDGFTVATIFGHVYLDSNNNGVQDPGEPNLPGVDVVLQESDGTVTTVTTDGNGDWMSEVEPGLVIADVDETTLPAGVTQTEGDDPTFSVAALGMNIDGGTDGYYQPAEVFGFVFFDEDGNGIFDGADYPLSGVDVVITQADGSTVIATTDAAGDWSSDVLPGATTADVDETTLPADVEQSAGVDPNTVTAVAGTSVDAGFDGYTLTEIFGHLYLDDNNNGVQDPGEPDLPNIDVILTLSDGSTLVVPSDANGDWMSVVPAGLTVADVDETDPDFPLVYEQTEGTDPTVIPVPLGSSTDAGNDGYYIGVPDITPVITFIPTNVNGVTDMFFTIKVQELLFEDTDGLITLIFPVDSRLTFTYDQSLTNFGPFSLDNPEWTYDGSNPSFHVWTSNTVIPGGSSSILGFEAVYDPQNTTGEVPFTVTIITGSGSEVNDANNIDAETLDYFSN